MDNNTFGDYVFEKWVPVKIQESIKKFWGCFERTYKDWLKDSEVQGQFDYCFYSLFSGFRMPRNGDFVEYIVRNRKLEEQTGESCYKIIAGRYIHSWNNMGFIIDKYGDYSVVSTCDRWVKWDGSEEELTEYLSKQ